MLGPLGGLRVGRLLGRGHAAARGLADGQRRGRLAARRHVHLLGGGQLHGLLLGSGPHHGAGDQAAPGPALSPGELHRTGGAVDGGGDGVGTGGSDRGTGQCHVRWITQEVYLVWLIMGVIHRFKSIKAKVCKICRKLSKFSTHSDNQIKCSDKETPPKTCVSVVLLSQESYTRLDSTIAKASKLVMCFNPFAPDAARRSIVDLSSFS